MLGVGKMQHRLFWRVVNAIEEKINDGSYVAGSRLPPERVLSEELSVSRPTIREAIIALEVRGKVVVKANSGVYLMEQPEKGLSESEISAFELTQARALVEGEAAALAAINITEDELAKLEQTIVDMSNEDPEKADAEFHQIIAAATRNKAISMTIKKFWNLRETNKQIKSAYRNVCYREDAQRLNEHQQILIALRTRKPENARVAMHEHFRRMINSLFEASEAKALEELKAKSNQTRGLYSIENIR